MFRRLANGLGVTFAFGCIVAIGTTAAWSSIVVPASRAYDTKAAFEQTFSDVAAMPQGANTATTREKLRNIGWNHFKLFANR